MGKKPERAAAQQLYDEAGRLLQLARGRGLLRGRVHSYPQRLQLVLECSARGGVGPCGHIVLQLAAPAGQCSLQHGSYTTTLAEQGSLQAMVYHAIWLATGKKPYIRTNMLKADYK